jgi:hypothetical protein
MYRLVLLPVLLRRSVHSRPVATDVRSVRVRHAPPLHRLHVLGREVRGAQRRLPDVSGAPLDVMRVRVEWGPPVGATCIGDLQRGAHYAEAVQRLEEGRGERAVVRAEEDCPVRGGQERGPVDRAERRIKRVPPRVVEAEVHVRFEARYRPDAGVIRAEVAWHVRQSTEAGEYAAGSDCDLPCP